MTRIYRIFRAIIHIIALTLWTPFHILYTAAFLARHRNRYKHLIEDSYERFNELDQVGYDLRQDSRMAQNNLFHIDGHYNCRYDHRDRFGL